jgi:hypothetical protein
MPLFSVARASGPVARVHNGQAWLARLNILFIGDVFGQPGREALARWLPGFREEHPVDFVIANHEFDREPERSSCSLHSRCPQLSLPPGGSAPFIQASGGQTPEQTESARPVKRRLAPHARIRRDAWVAGWDVLPCCCVWSDWGARGAA